MWILGFGSFINTENLVRIDIAIQQNDKFLTVEEYNSLKVEEIVKATFIAIDVTGKETIILISNGPYGAVMANARSRLQNIVGEFVGLGPPPQKNPNVEH